MAKPETLKRSARWLKLLNRHNQNWRERGRGTTALLMAIKRQILRDIAA